jgi:phosphate-selective porin OprO/OprP
VQLPDAYVDTRFSPRFRVRVGKDKTPVGYELLMSDASGWFPERALTSSLVPNRDLGVQAQGDLDGGKVVYAAGLFNGVPDGLSSSAGIDTNHGKDVAGRVAFQPVRGIGVHLGASTGTESNGLPSFRTSIGQRYFSYATGVVAAGRRNRVSPAAFFYRGAFGAFAEYARSTQAVAHGGVTTDVSNTSWAVNASYALTGEAVSDRNLRPRSPFDAANRRWGAVQVLARYSALRVDRSAFAAALASPGASRTADQYTAAVNWYPTTFVKWYAAYEWTSFDREARASRPAEHAILVRAQVAF